MQYVLFASPLALKCKGSERVVHLFRWDSRFTSFIINSPVYFNSNSHLDLKSTYLNYLCNSTNGQVVEVTPASVVQSIIRQFLVPSADPPTLAHESLAPLYPSIKVQVNPSFLGQQSKDFLSIVVPLIGSAPDAQCSRSELIDRIYASAPDSPLFYCYPEQRGQQSVFPVFQLRNVVYSEKEPLEKMLADCKLPFDWIEVNSNEVIESTNQALGLLMQVVNGMKENNEMAFLFGEDNLVYGMVSFTDKCLLKILFFPPDFPLLIDYVRNNKLAKIVEWIKMIPLEYVPPIYAFLERKKIQLPFLCPSLPPRKK